MKKIWVIGLALQLCSIGGFVITLRPALSASAPAESEGKRLLQKLIEAARKEGQMDLMIVSSVGEKGAKELVDAFKKRFGLNITMNADLSGQESQKFNQAVAETKGRIPPTFDLIEGTAENVLVLNEAGGAETIDNWEQLLAEIAPEAHKVKDQVSPTALSGYGFMRGTRTVVLLYNPKIIPEAEIPRTW